jgi:hypothetical protein
MQERRRSPRPPAWLNLLILILAAGTFFYARHHRRAVDAKTAILFQRNGSSPEELNRMRDELAKMDLTREELAKQIDAKMQYLDSLRGSQFYIAIDTTRRTLQFRLGRDVVRECPVQIGERRTIAAANGKTWTFVPLKGGFNVVDKGAGYAWPVPDWLYAMQGIDPPPQRQVVSHGLGQYVVFLPNNYVIHTPPPPESPLQGPKPGSFMVPEADMAAIWARISPQTRVYIF